MSLEQLAATLEPMTPPPEDQEVKPTDPYEVIRLTIGYLTHNQTRMDYPRYRRKVLEPDARRNNPPTPCRIPQRRRAVVEAHDKPPGQSLPAI